jgi:nucleoside-diphosphate-sugar epimerase
MRIMITGVRGFLGSFFQEGNTVCGTSSSGAGPTDAFPSEIKIARLALGDPVSSRIFEEIDYVIHRAHNFSSGAFEQNVEGTRRIFEAAKSSGVPLQAFVSSYSATPSSVTDCRGKNGHGSPPVHYRGPRQSHLSWFERR